MGAAGGAWRVSGRGAPHPFARLFLAPAPRALTPSAPRRAEGPPRPGRPRRRRAGRRLLPLGCPRPCPSSRLRFRSEAARTSNPAVLRVGRAGPDLVTRRSRDCFRDDTAGTGPWSPKDLAVLGSEPSVDVAGPGPLLTLGGKGSVL